MLRIISRIPLIQANLGHPYCRKADMPGPRLNTGKALELPRKTMPGHVLIAFSESPPGEYLMVEKRHLEAEALLARGYTGMKSTLSNRDLRVVEGRQRMVTFYDLWPHAIAK